MPRLIRFMILVACLAGSGATQASAHSVAEGRYVRPSLLEYGWSGFGTGLSLGLASGYLATGKTFQSGEWRTVVFGAGVGAVSGIGVGLLFGLVDVGQSPATPGAIVLRDIGYGITLGALGGLVIGVVVAVDDGKPRDLVVGSAVGTLVGAGVGLVLGTIEAAIEGSGGADSEYGQTDSPPLRFTVGAARDAQGDLVWMPTALGRF